MSLIDAILDTMLPGGEGFPPASATGAAAWLEGQARFRPALDDLASRLPPDFATSAPGARTEMLRILEAEEPAVFDAATVAIYSAYYTRPAVLAAIEAARGYKAAPPQPGGYALAPFDAALLAVPAARAALWRDPDKEVSP